MYFWLLLQKYPSDLSCFCAPGSHFRVLPQATSISNSKCEYNARTVNPCAHTHMHTHTHTHTHKPHLLHSFCSEKDRLKFSCVLGSPDLHQYSEVCARVCRAHLEASTERWNRLLSLLEELGCWISVKDEELNRQMPIGGDVPTVLQQQIHCTVRVGHIPRVSTAHIILYPSPLSPYLFLLSSSHLSFFKLSYCINASDSILFNAVNTMAGLWLATTHNST